MSRSRRKTPIRGMCGGSHVSEKALKRQSNKVMRNIARDGLHLDETQGLPTKPWNVIDPWNGAKDGKVIYPKKASQMWLSHSTQEAWDVYRAKQLRK